jgi:hypothetical protein
VENRSLKSAENRQQSVRANRGVLFIYSNCQLFSVIFWMDAGEFKLVSVIYMSVVNLQSFLGDTDLMVPH